MEKMSIEDAVLAVQQATQADITRSGQSHVDLIQAIHRLQLLAETPQETLMRIRFQPLEGLAISMALEAGILDAIATHKESNVAADELAARTRFDALFIARVMRVVTHLGLVDEVGPATYRSNERTQQVVTKGLSAGHKHHYDLIYPVACHIIDFMRQTNNFKRLDPMQSPHSSNGKTAFQHAYNGRTMWEVLQDDSEQGKYFHDYMAIRRLGLATWYETFPMSKVLCPGASRDPESVFLVDVGGSLGHETLAFHEAYPNHPGRLIVQDLPCTIENITHETLPKRVEFLAHDFFRPQPIKGARAYYFRNIFHDWDDNSSEKILYMTAAAMKKGYSRLLIDDYVLPDTGAPIRGSSMDLLMMLYVGGIERTKCHWETLLHKCGLEVVRIWSTRSDYEQIIEAKLMD